MPSKLKICRKLSEIHELIACIRQTKYMSFDFETTSKWVHKSSAKITILSISFQPGSAWVVPLGNFDSPFRDNWIPILKMFQPLFEDWEIIKVAWNLKFEWKWLKRYGINLYGRLFDGMLAKYCLDEERPNDLKSMVAKLIPEFADYELEVKGNDWSKIPLEKLSKYGGLDADLTLRLMLFFEPKLIKLGFYNLFRNLLMMATRVLGESEQKGVPIDKPYLEGLDTKYGALIAEAERAMRSNRTVVRFDASKRVETNAKLLAAVDEEIREVLKGDSKQKARMIEGREAKKRQIIAGTFTGKVGKLKASEPVNFKSVPQLIELFFTHPNGLKFKSIKNTTDKKTKRESNNPSTDESVLLELEKKDKSGFITLMLKHRELSKLHSTYIKGMLELLSEDSKLHANFKVHGTVTGRLSCTEPNLQNIPRDTTASDIKKMFIPPPGMLLLEVDYGQAELRVVAEIADDDVMIDIFQRDWNIHVATAAKAHIVQQHLEDTFEKMYDFAKAQIKKAEGYNGEELYKKGMEDLLYWAKQKKKAKTINFGIIYGQGDEKLAEGMGVPVEEASEFRKSWLDTYPKTKKWMERQWKFAMKNGYVPMLFGRKRRLPDAMFKDKWEAKRQGMMGKYMEAMRQAVNAPVQGTGSDFGTFSQVIIRKMKQYGELPGYMQQAYTVHDSIGFFIRPEDIHWVVPILVEVCNNPETQRYFGFELKKVRMKVSPEVGKSWGSLTGYDPWQNYAKWIEPAKP